MPTEKLEILLHVHQTQHDVSLAHLNAIFNAFSLTVTGLLVLTAGIVTIGHIPFDLKSPMIVVVLVVFGFISNLIRDQRRASERSVKIFRAIDTELGLFDKGKYLAGESVLPMEFSNPQRTLMGFSLRVDLPLVITLAVLTVGLVAVIFLSPASTSCP